MKTLEELMKGCAFEKAFPMNYGEEGFHVGMIKHEFYTAAAIQGILSNPVLMERILEKYKPDTEEFHHEISALALSQADSLCAMYDDNY